MSWEAVVIAALVIVIIGVMASVAILRYAVDDAIRVWEMLNPMVGVITGMVATYFFTRGTAAAERERANTLESLVRKKGLPWSQVNGNSEHMSRQSVVVAGVLAVTIAGVMIVAMLSYTAGDVLKFWGVLVSLVGVITGAVPTYFFTRDTAAKDRSRANKLQKVARDEGLI